MINQDFSEWQRAQGYCESIVKTSRGHLKCFRGFLLRNDISSPTLITPGSQTLWVNSYRQDLLDEGKSPNTVNAHLYTLKSYFKFLGYGGHQSARVPEERSRPKALSAKNQWRLFWIVDRALPIRDKAIIYTAFYAGLSVAELAAMNVEDITFYNDGGKLKVPCRTRLKGRRVEILPPLRVVIKEYLHDLTENGQYQGPQRDADGQIIQTPLWKNYQGKRLSITSLQSIVALLSDLLGVRISLNTIRNTWLAAESAKRKNDRARLARMSGLKRGQTLAHYKDPVIV